MWGHLKRQLSTIGFYAAGSNAMHSNSERDKNSDGKQINVKETIQWYYGEALQTRCKDYFTVTGYCNEHYGEFTDCPIPLPGRDDPLHTIHSERCC